MRVKGFLVLACAAVSVAGFWPAAGSAATFRGIVVGKQAGSLLVASPSGVVTTLAGRAAIGSRVAFAGGHAIVVGRARTAHIHGIVVRRIGTTLILSSNRHLVAIHNARVLADTTPTTPTTTGQGAVVNATVDVSNGELDEQSETDVGQSNATSIQVQAVVAQIGTGTITLNVQGQMLTVPLPAGLTLPASVVGQTVTISLSLGGQNDQGDDDQGGDQGSSSHQGSGDGGGGDD
jgi:hypothetical protein